MTINPKAKQWSTRTKLTVKPKDISVRKFMRRERLPALYKYKSYQIWAGMIERCTSKNAVGYERYGGRGIKVCERWKSNFENFLKDMGEIPDGYSLGRINNDGDYEKSNCQWETQKDQARNHSRNLKVTINGVTKCATDWANHFGIKPRLFISRLRYGWSIEAALTYPVLKHWPRAGVIPDRTKPYNPNS